MIHIVVDAPWLLRLIGSVLGWAALILLIVYLIAGPWWTLTAGAVLLALTVTTVKLARRWTR